MWPFKIMKSEVIERLEVLENALVIQNAKIGQIRKYLNGPNEWDERLKSLSTLSLNTSDILLVISNKLDKLLELRENKYYAMEYKGYKVKLWGDRDTFGFQELHYIMETETKEGSPAIRLEGNSVIELESDMKVAIDTLIEELNKRRINNGIF